MPKVLDKQSASKPPSLRVRANSEIPLPSPSFYSSSCLGRAATESNVPLQASSLWGCWGLVRAVADPLLAPSTKGSGPCVTLELMQSNQKSQDIDQLGSLAGAARLLQHNASVLKHCSDGTEISPGGEGQRCCSSRDCQYRSKMCNHGLAILWIHCGFGISKPEVSEKLPQG